MEPTFVCVADEVLQAIFVAPMNQSQHRDILLMSKRMSNALIRSCGWMDSAWALRQCHQSDRVAASDWLEHSSMIIDLLFGIALIDPTDLTE
jgi:hypothetical protein